MTNLGDADNRCVHMKLYMNDMSPNVRRVRLTAAVLEIELEEKKLDLAKGEQRSPEYLAINPNGAVPTLVDGDFVLTESRAIMQYLAAMKPESGLLPRDDRARADVVRWQFWDSAHFSPALGTLFFQKILKRMIDKSEPDSQKIDEALATFRRLGAVLNDRLGSKRYVVGTSLTIADLTLASSLMYAKQTEAPLSDFPNVEAWFGRIGEMDAWKKTAP